MSPFRPTVTQKYIPAFEGGPYSSYGPRGYPFRQGPMPLKLQELDDLRYSCDFGCRAFNLSDPEDLKAYTELMDKIYNKLFRLVGPIPQPAWDEKAQTWRVFVQWLEVKAEVPPYVLKMMGLPGSRR